jgi:hypothetical protein
MPTRAPGSNAFPNIRSFEDFLALLYRKKCGDYSNSWNAAPDFSCTLGGQPWQFIDIEECGGFICWPYYPEAGLRFEPNY